jgi:hypothetical protein
MSATSRAGSARSGCSNRDDVSSRRPGRGPRRLRPDPSAHGVVGDVCLVQPGQTRGGVRLQPTRVRSLTRPVDLVAEVLHGRPR